MQDALCPNLVDDVKTPILGPIQRWTFVGTLRSDYELENVSIHLLNRKITSI